MKHICILTVLFILFIGAMRITDTDFPIKEAKQTIIEVNRNYNNGGLLGEDDHKGGPPLYGIEVADQLIYFENSYKNVILLIDFNGKITKTITIPLNYKIRCSSLKLTKSFIFIAVQDKTGVYSVLKINKSNFEIQKIDDVNFIQIINYDNDDYFLMGHMMKGKRDKYEFNFTAKCVIFENKVEKKETFSSMKDLVKRRRLLNEQPEDEEGNIYSSLTKRKEEPFSSCLRIENKYSEKIREIKNKKYEISPIRYINKKLYCYFLQRNLRPCPLIIGIIDTKNLSIVKIFKVERKKFIPIFVPFIGRDGNYYYVSDYNEQKIFITKVILNED